MRQRRAYGDAGIHAGDDIDNRDPRFLRPAAREIVTLAGDAHESAHALDHEVIAGAFRVRPGLTESGDRAVHEPWVERLQGLVTQAIARQVPHLEVFEQHIALHGEPAHDGLPLGPGKIDCDGFLAAIGAREICRLGGVVTLCVLEPWRPESLRIITGLRTFDLDDFGSQICEVLAGPWRSEHAGKIDDFYVG